MRQLRCDGTNKQPTITNEEPLQNNWARLPNDSSTTQLDENNQTGDVNRQLVTKE